MTTDEYVSLLNELRGSEFRMAALYRMAAQMMTGPWRDALAKEFHEHAKAELKHADLVMLRIVALGGKIDTNIAEMPPSWSDFGALLKGINELEKKGIELWYKLYNSIPADDAFKHTVTDILSQEQEHYDESARWLREHAAPMVKDGSESTQKVRTKNSDDNKAVKEDIQLGGDDGEALEDEPGGVDDDSEYEYPVVGDLRQLVVYGTGPNYTENQVVGNAWQDEQGIVHGTGICDMMTFEPFSKELYKRSSIGLDSSPLSILAFRLSMSPFVRVEWEVNDE